MNIDVEKIRRWREEIRKVIGFEDGKPITQEQLSATMAALCEVWTMRIYCSPEKHTPLDPVALMKLVSGEVAALFQDQAKRLLPHSKTFSFFKEGR